MAEFLNTSKAYAEIEDIINKTKNKLVLISPYIKIPEPLLERLKYMDGKDIKIIVVCRKKDLNHEVRSDLKQLKNLELRFDENLHAKCFYNEESMVITSLNLHEHSQQHNREMGVLLSLEHDHHVFNEARDEAEFIVSRAEKDSLVRSVFDEVVKEVKSIVDSTTKADLRKTKPTSRTKQKGYCIRCRTPIPYELDYPLCDECFEVWAQYGDLDYPEHYCHTCGKRASTSKAKPECNSCYKPRGKK